MSAEIDVEAAAGRGGRRDRVLTTVLGVGSPQPGHRLLRLSAATLLTGLGAGLTGAAFAALLHGVQHVALGPAAAGVTDSVAGVPEVRRILAPVLAGLLAGLLWWRLRRRERVVPVTTVLADPARRLALDPTWVDAVLQTVVVGAGASIGREGAPRQGAAALATVISDRMGLDDRERRVLVAAAAGAGLAAVYDVPLTGVVYVLEVLLLSRRWRVALVAALASGVATVTAWPVVGHHPVYALPAAPVGPGTWAAAALAVPLTALVGIAFARATSVSRRVTVHRSALLPLTVAAAGVLTAVVSWWLPEVPGNGKAVLDAAFLGTLGLAAAVALALAKPALTAGWLWAGAAGGLLTPALATGGALGAAVARVAAAAGHPLPVAQVALVMAVGVLAVTQRAPLFAASFGVELTHPSPVLALVLLLTAVGARTVAEAVRGVLPPAGARAGRPRSTAAWHPTRRR